MIWLWLLLAVPLGLFVWWKLYRAYNRWKADYLLDWFDGDRGRGYTLIRASDRRRLRWQTLTKKSGLKVFPVAGVKRRQAVLRNYTFNAGQPLKLVPEPDNPVDPNAIAVYDKRGTTQVGYVPSDDLDRVHEMLRQDPNPVCISLWESQQKGRRVGLRVLLAVGDVHIARR